MSTWFFLRLSDLNHRKKSQKKKKNFWVGGPQMPFSLSSSFILFFVLLPFFIKTKVNKTNKWAWNFLDSQNKTRQKKSWTAILHFHGCSCYKFLSMLKKILHQTFCDSFCEPKYNETEKELKDNISFSRQRLHKFLSMLKKTSHQMVCDSFCRTESWLCTAQTPVHQKEVILPTDDLVKMAMALDLDVLRGQSTYQARVTALHLYMYRPFKSTALPKLLNQG